MTNKAIILVSLLVTASFLSAWSITDTYFGNPFGASDARSYTMGGAGTYNDMRPMGFTENPANLTLIRKHLGLSFNSYINRNEDNRSIPLYNSFDNYVDDAVYSSNINVHDNFAGGVFAAYILGSLDIGAGFYHKPLLSFDADYVEEVRNNRNTDDDLYPEKIAENKITSEGSLNQTGFAIALGFGMVDYMQFNFGIDYSSLKGDIKRDVTIRWTDWATTAVQAVGNFNLPELTETDDYELSGNQLKLGAAVKVNSRFGIAATFVPKVTLDKKGTSYYKRDAFLTTAMDSTNISFKEDYDRPAQWRVGFSYIPRNVMRTVFNMDVEYVMHSDIDKMFKDVVNLYAGVEHHVVNRVPLRLGFQAVNNWFFTAETALDEDDNPVSVFHVQKVLTPMITAGSSVNLTKNIIIDLGFGYTWREYEAKDLFGDAYYNDKQYTGAADNDDYALWPNYHLNLQNRGWENPDKVRENNISLNAGLSFAW